MDYGKNKEPFIYKLKRFTISDIAHIIWIVLAGFMLFKTFRNIVHHYSDLSTYLGSFSLGEAILLFLPILLFTIGLSTFIIKSRLRYKVVGLEQREAKSKSELDKLLENELFQATQEDNLFFSENYLLCRGEDLPDIVMPLEEIENCSIESQLNDMADDPDSKSKDYAGEIYFILTSTDGREHIALLNHSSEIRKGKEFDEDLQRHSSRVDDFVQLLNDKGINVDECVSLFTKNTMEF